jgi:hypothetical protein
VMAADPLPVPIAERERIEQAERDRIARFAAEVSRERFALAVADPDGEAEAVLPIETLASVYELKERGQWVRTLADVSDDPPGPLLFGMLEPDGPNCAIAAPGTGKGTTGAWMIGEAQRAGLLPVVFDAERRPREWARRVSGLGGDRSRVIYIEPTDLPTSQRGRPLWEAAPAIGAIIKHAGGDFLMVDSIMPATGVGEDRLRSDAQVPFLWVAALDSLGIPSLSFGHPPKGQPEGEPFGSFAWVAAMRLTWLGTKAEGDGHRIRWRPRKRNERGHILGVLFDHRVRGRRAAMQRHPRRRRGIDSRLASGCASQRTARCGGHGRGHARRDGERARRRG